MKKIVAMMLLAVPVIAVAGILALVFTSGLKSDPKVGLSPDTHQVDNVNVRKFTQAPLGAEVKVFLPVSPQQAMAIVVDFGSYSKWVSPAPEKVVVDNSGSGDGKFGAGSSVSYEEGQSDVIEYFDSNLAMIAKPLWGTEDFTGHRGVVLISKHDQGSIMHMRRYFETKSLKGWMMSKLMPMFMKSSAENLAAIYGGKVL